MKKYVMLMLLSLFIMTTTTYSQNTVKEKAKTETVIIQDTATMVIAPTIVFSDSVKTMEDTIETVIQKPEYKNISEILSDIKVIYKEYKKLKNDPDTTGMGWFNYITLLLVIIVAIITFIITHYIYKNKAKKNSNNKQIPQ